MTFVRRRGLTRLAATALATGMIAAGAVATAGQAAADDNVGQGGATATLGDLTVSDRVDVVVNGETKTYGAGLFYLTADDGGTLKTYCIDFGTPAEKGSHYKETGWSSSSLADNPDAGKINWILQNSYPVNDDLAALAAEAGADSLTQEQAAAGTQAAIWAFSDGVDATPKNEDAKKLADYLKESATEVEEPRASLELDPPQIAGQPGGQLGPVTVHTSAESAVVTPDAGAADQGVNIIDADGQLVTESTPVADGAELFFDVPEGADDGSTSLSATVTTEVPVGRAFTGRTPADEPSQTMILAGSSDSSVTASASASWASEGPSPTVTAAEKCVEGGVEVTATNDGDQPFTFELGDEEHSVAPGESTSVLVPVEDKQAYEIVIENPADADNPWKFSGVLDCETGSDGGKEEAPEGTEPASTGGSGGDDGPDLAETGSSSSPMLIVGIAVVLLALGGGAVFFLRKRSTATTVE